ncbi:energy-coupling factor ABC transporter ATP-binding protein [Anaeromassilibacillus senegalensis]|uniref:energy-coupling factor ABC transporter ATP-binding protein n=1 Tax=Anaeromassilibacillus senegalensis TaxID=1673717 RepID=UPI00067FDDAC|nr:ABC transporter ATP-binding protein [Anaeromassilibacillus senegalensis]
MREIICFDHVSYAYEKGQDALSDVSVSIHEGEKIAVLGNNGAGKSTFFLLANGVLCPQKGRILFSGSAVGKKEKELNRLRRGVGLVFQDPDEQLLAGTVEEEISFGPMNLLLEEADVRRRVDQSIDMLRLESLRDRAPQYLSGGEKKRVSIADVLAMEPEMLLLDEPTSSLDPANTKRLEQTLNMLNAKGLALVVATHHVDFAWRWAERVLVFHAGRLVADASTKNVFADQALLQKCNLEQPILYQVGKALGLASLPRTVEEFIAGVKGKQ